MIIGVPKETFAGERRVALVPDSIAPLGGAGMQVLVQSGAGENAGFPNSVYEQKGARIARSREEVFSTADIIVYVRGLGANREGYRSDIALLRPEHTLLGFLDPLVAPGAVRDAAQRGCTVFALEQLPRITRAQSMDALSSMATVAGYKAVLVAAERLPRMFPMLMTAAGVVYPARVFVIGAGVAGLQAIATAKRLGAVVHAYDVRPAVREEIQSLGAKFLELSLETGQTQTAGGYATRMDEDFYRRQRDLMTRVLAESDVVISTAVIPGKPAPILITREMVCGMGPGSVIVDLAAERGGNCDQTKPGESVVIDGVTVIGPLNLPSTVAFHASQMYAKNISNFLQYLVKKGMMTAKQDDELIAGMLIAQGGEVVHPEIRGILGLAPVKPVGKEEA